MSIHFSAANPNALLNQFRSGIDKGHIVTWSYDKDGDFTHTPDQWKSKAWLRPKVTGGELVFTIIPPKSQHISSEVYAIYHGRFIEAMLKHCDAYFSTARATSFPSDGDQIE